MNKNILTLSSIIETKFSFVITSHINPDGDAIGSEVALARFLADKGKLVYILNQSETPANLRFLEKIHPVFHYNEPEHAQFILNADCFIVIDTNSVKRFQALSEPLQKTKAIKIIIDHHLEHEHFADINIIDTHVPATCELLFFILHSIDGDAITKPVADALYTGIMTDTQSFRLPFTDSETHRVAAELLKKGVQPYEIYQEVYESGAINTLHLLGKALASIRLHENGKIAVMSLPRSIFIETNTHESDVDNLTQYVQSIGGVKIGIVVMELDDGVKISFRSKGEIPVNEAAKQFGGGGHRNAAGAKIKNATLENIISDILEKTKIYLPQEKQ